MSEGATRIVPSKLSPPSAESTAIVRQRALQLARGDAACIIVSGMSGFGKSVFAAQWAAEQEDVGWLNVDSLDADSTVFWSHVLAALSAVDPELVAEPTRLLVERGPDDRTFVVALLAGLEARSTPAALVIDGLDQHVDRAVIEMIGVLVERSDDRLRILITTQTEPPLPLGRWRSRGIVTEVREDDLRLSPEEAIELASRHDVAMAADDVVALNAVVDGWPLAFTLALMSDWRLTDVSGAPGELAADVSMVAQLTAHILAGLDDEERVLALTASVLEHPDVDTLVRLAGPESAPALRRLLRQHTLLTVDDPGRGTLRFRPLIRRLLESELGWRDPIRRDELHRQAATIRREQGDLRASYQHLTAIGQHDRAVEMLLEPAYDTVNRGDVLALRTLAGRLPAPGSVEDVDLALELGLIAAWGDGTVAARRWSERASELALSVSDDVRRADDQLGVRRLDVVIATLDADLVPAVRLADELPLPRARRRRRMDLHVDFVVARALLAARHPAAHDWVQRVSAGSELPIVANATIPTLEAWHDWMCGRLDAALERSERSIAWLVEHEIDAHHWSFDTFITAGWCRLSAGDVAGARTLADRAAATAERIPLAWNQLQSTYLLGRCLLAAGDAAGALVAVEVAQATVPFDDARPYTDRLRHLAAEAAIGLGRVDQASVFASQMGPGVSRQLIRARIEPLSDQRLERELDGRHGWPMAARIQAEVLLAARAPSTEASPGLLAILEEGAATGWVQPFLGLGPRAERVVRSLPLEQLHPRLGAALSGQRRTELRAADGRPELTPREMSVLELLPTHLSYAELGARLYLSVNTVKSCLKSLYRKLDVHTRTDAVDTARSHGLI